MLYRFRPEKRTQTFERLRAEISAVPAVTAAIEASQKFERIAAVPKKVPVETAKPKKEVSGFVWVITSCVAMLVVFVAIGIIWMNHSGAQSQLAAQGPVSASSSQSDGALSSQDSDSDQIVVPNLVGQDYAGLTASSNSDDSDQDYQVLLSSQQFSDTVPEGKIISQDPKPGTKMTKGSAIVVIVSQGTAVRTLPSIAGKTLPEASAAVTGAGFVPTQAGSYSNTVEKGKVIGYKDVTGGSQMAYGSKVTILVSLGHEPTSSAQNSSSTVSFPQSSHS